MFFLCMLIRPAMTADRSGVLERSVEFRDKWLSVRGTDSGGQMCVKGIS